MEINKTSIQHPEDINDINSIWKHLYKIGGMVALIMAVFIPIQVAVFVLWPPPKTVIEWFTLFQNNKLIGLLDMDLLLIVDQVFMALIFLALYMSLRRFNQSFMTIALTLGLIGTATYFASGSAFEMLNLSNQYSVATTEGERTTILAAGQVMLANWQGTAFDVAYVIQGISLLIIAVVMFQSKLFGKVTAYVAIFLAILSLVPPTVGTIGMIFALGSLVPLEIWTILIGRRLLQLGKT